MSNSPALELNGVLNSSKKQSLFHHYFLVPARVWGLVSLLGATNGLIHMTHDRGNIILLLFGVYAGVFF